jgi:hypothetical protein
LPLIFTKTVKKMMNRAIGFIALVALLYACQETEGFEEEYDQINEISPEDLPKVSQEYIEDNFTGELVESAYSITSAQGVGTYEAFLTNQVNLIFDADGDLEGFGEEAGRIECDGQPQEGMGPRMGKGPKRGSGRDGGQPEGDSLRPKPEEIEMTALPIPAQDYLNENYADSTILKVLKGTNPEGETGFHVLVKHVGALVFDADGNFIELRERRGGGCSRFEKVAVEDLPEAVAAYLRENYADITLLGARIGTIQEEVHIHVMLEGIGVAIFDEAGNFLDVKTCGMDRG